MPTITRKIELKLCTEGLSDEERKAQRGLLYHINDNLYKAANNISSKLYLDDHVSAMVRLKHATLYLHAHCERSWTKILIGRWVKLCQRTRFGREV